MWQQLRRYELRDAKTQLLNEMINIKNSSTIDDQTRQTSLAFYTHTLDTLESLFIGSVIAEGCKVSPGQNSLIIDRTNGLNFETSLKYFLLLDSIVYIIPFLEYGELGFSGDDFDLERMYTSIKWAPQSENEYRLTLPFHLYRMLEYVQPNKNDLLLSWHEYYEKNLPNSTDLTTSNIEDLIRRYELISASMAFGCPIVTSTFSLVPVEDVYHSAFFQEWITSKKQNVRYIINLILLNTCNKGDFGDITPEDILNFRFSKFKQNVILTTEDILQREQQSGEQPLEQLVDKISTEVLPLLREAVSNIKLRRGIPFWKGEDFQLFFDIQKHIDLGRDRNNEDMFQL